MGFARSPIFSKQRKTLITFFLAMGLLQLWLSCRRGSLSSHLKTPCGFSQSDCTRRLMSAACGGLSEEPLSSTAGYARPLRLWRTERAPPAATLCRPSASGGRTRFIPLSRPTAMATTLAEKTLPSGVEFRPTNYCHLILTRFPAITTTGSANRVSQY